MPPYDYRDGHPKESHSAQQIRGNKTEADFDNAAITSFASAMSNKMSQTKAQGRTGWQEIQNYRLWEMLYDCVQKGDPVDVANLAMMIHQNTQAGRG
jgi:hypothetical protein